MNDNIGQITTAEINHIFGQSESKPSNNNQNAFQTAMQNGYNQFQDMMSMFNGGNAPRRPDYQSYNQNPYAQFNQQTNQSAPMNYGYGYTENAYGNMPTFNQPKQDGYYGFTNPDYGR
jgi:hypothetical protein